MGGVLYCSGQIALHPSTGQLVSDDFKAQAVQVFENLKAVVLAAGADLKQTVRLTVYLVDLKNMPITNEVMSQFFEAPYPARTTIQVAALPKGAKIEVDAVVAMQS
jgi:reactive intermediate/imine deaminase